MSFFSSLDACHTNLLYRMLHHAPGSSWRQDAGCYSLWYPRVQSQYGLVGIYCIIYIIIQYCHYFINQILQLWWYIESSFWLLWPFDILLLFWAIPYFLTLTRCSSLIYTFPVPALEFTCLSIHLWFLYWRVVFRNQALDARCVHCYSCVARS